MDISLDAVVSLIGLASFGLLILPASLRWRMKEKATLTLSIYLGLGLIWSIGVAVTTLELAPTTSQQLFFEWLTSISRSALPLVFGALTLAFLGRTKGLYWYWAIGLVFLGLSIGVNLNIYNIQGMILTYLPDTIDIQVIISTMEIIIWSVATIITLSVLYVAFLQYPQAQYRNRFYYWFGGTVILSAANIIILSQLSPILWIGSALNIVGTLVIAYIVMRHHPPDLQIVVNRIVQSITVTAGLGVIIFGAFNIAYLMSDWQVNPTSAILLVAMSVAAGFILPRISEWMNRTMIARLFGTSVDESSTIKAYSQNISSDWDFQKLSQQALRFILQEMQTNRGGLFVDQGDGSGHVTLELISGENIAQETPGYFEGDNPWIMHLRQEQTPVTQFDIDVLPQYRDMDEDAKNWLLSLDVELFFPIILRQRELIGVFALGSKPYHRPYTSHDLARLQVLSSQIALDMDKAKLFRQLGAVNQKLGDLSEKFDSFDQGKTDFLSIASHELRTPLTHIHGYASMLMEASEEELQNPAYLQHIFNGIAKGSGRLKNIVDLIFDVSRADIGELDIAFDPVSLIDVIKQAIENQQAAIDERGHQLMMTGVDKLPLIEGDMTRLVQAFIHLLNNAIKYTPDNGRITITGQHLQENKPEQVKIIVADNGIGINKEDQERIFDKFYRVGGLNTHSTGSVKFKGAGPGLGLSLVDGIAKSHHGKVWVESTEYNEETCPGSQFHIVLPVKQPENGSEEQTSQATTDATSASKIETRHWRSEDIKAIKQKLAKQQSENGS